MVRELKKSIRQYKSYTLLTPLVMIGEVFMEVLIPALMANIIDYGINKADMDYIMKESIVLICCALLSLTFGCLGSYFGAKASSGFATNLRHDLFYRIQDFSFRDIDEFSPASLITRLTTDVQRVQQAFLTIIKVCFRAPIMLLFSIIMVARNGGAITAVFCVAVPILGFSIYHMMRKVHPVFMRVFKHYDGLNRVVRENLIGIKTVKAYVRENEERKKFNDSSDLIHDDFLKAERVMVKAGPLMMGIAYLSMLFIAYFGAKEVVSGTMMTGQLMSVFSYTMQILGSLMMIAMIIVNITMARSSAERILEVLRTEPTMDTNENGETVVKDGSVVFKDVSFSYVEGRHVLEGVNLDIKAGETIGILGRTGSGKSTLVSLMARLYDVSSGEILVGGRNVKDYNLRALRDGVSVVLQKNLLFSGTVRSNMKWGNKEAADEEIFDALKVANADFIKDLDYPVEQGGDNFSGGQKQRLCIARALLKKPKILIFDDSTSAVDTATDASIRQGLRQIGGRVTKFIISQRVSSVMDSDRIILVNQGRIDAIGSHEELMRASADYRELVAVQEGGRQNG